jgi:L-threonylcarbamoyladenylate synthase
MLKYDIEIEKSIDTLKKGGIIIYPTDTVWGIGCDATNENAISRIYKLKKRDEKKSLIILLDSENKLLKYVKEVPEQAYKLIEYSERPITIIYNNAVNLPENLVADDGSIAIRIVKDSFAHALIAKFRKPIVSTSANVSGENAPIGYADISEQVLNGADYVIDLPALKQKNAKPSIIVKIDMKGHIKFIRK